MLTKSIFVLLLSGFLFAQQDTSKTQAAPGAKPATGAKPASDGAARSTSALQKQIRELQQQLDAANNQIAEATRRINALDHTHVTFDPGAPGGYGRLDSVLGTILVSVGTIEPYRDGLQCELRIGNPYATNFVGFDIDATWGRKTDFNHYAAWKSSLKKQHFTFTDTLTAAHWTSVTLALPATKAEAFHYLDISIKTDVVSMNVGSPRE